MFFVLQLAQHTPTLNHFYEDGMPKRPDKILPSETEHEVIRNRFITHEKAGVYHIWGKSAKPRD